MNYDNAHVTVVFMLILNMIMQMNMMSVLWHDTLSCG
jgi:hypothetical protein